MYNHSQIRYKIFNLPFLIILQKEITKWLNNDSTHSALYLNAQIKISKLIEQKKSIEKKQDISTA